MADRTRRDITTTYMSSSKRGNYEAETCPKQDKLCEVRATIRSKKVMILWGSVRHASECRQGNRICGGEGMSAMRELAWDARSIGRKDTETRRDGREARYIIIPPPL